MRIRIIALGMLTLLFVLFDRGSMEAQNPPTPAAAGGQTDALAPEFDLENVAGGRTRSVEIQGKIVVLNFWATWAAPSNAQIPSLNKLQETFAERGVQVMAIAASSGTLEHIKPKVTEFAVKYPVLIGDDSVEKTFGLPGFPSTYVLTRDTQGWRIYKKYFGLPPSLAEKIQKDIETLLGEK